MVAGLDWYGGSLVSVWQKVFKLCLSSPPCFEFFYIIFLPFSTVAGPLSAVVGHFWLWSHHLMHGSFGWFGSAPYSNHGRPRSTASYAVVPTVLHTVCTAVPGSLVLYVYVLYVLVCLCMCMCSMCGCMYLCMSTPWFWLCGGDILVIFLALTPNDPPFHWVFFIAIFLTFLVHPCYNVLYIQSKDWIIF